MPKGKSGGGSKGTKTSHRSAVNGRYVTKKYAASHPNTTVKETDKK